VTNAARTPAIHSDLEKRVRAVLDGAQGEAFLVDVLFEFTIAARADAYVETGNDVRHCYTRLREYNEKFHRIAGQLLGYHDIAKKNYPNDVFARILLEASDEIRAGVTYAVESALRRTDAQMGGRPGR
jgi:hypothetical protein